jgi:hypothetical protein
VNPSTLKSVKRRYAEDERPLASFIGVMGVYAGAVLAAAGTARARHIELPERPAPTDLALVSAATFKVARLLSKASITGPIRAPFTEFEGQSGEAEVAESAVGTGPRKAVGELLTCPFCLDQWVATGFVAGLVLKPRLTRWVAAAFATVAAADTLQFGYDALQQPRS